MKHTDIDEYINAFPELRKWIRECPICHAKGYDPQMPDGVGSSLNPGYAARVIKKGLGPLEVDEMGFCAVCAKYINKKEHTPMKLLVVVDYQKDFVDGALGFPGAENLDAGIAAKIRAYSQRGDYIVQTMDTHQADYLSTREGKHLPVPHCIAGTDGWMTYGETARAIAEVENSSRYHRIDKATFGVHPQDMMDLLAWIGGSEITEIELVGLVSNICVISNLCVFQGAFPLAQMVVDPQLIASFDPKTHEAVLDVMRGLQVLLESE